MERQVLKYLFLIVDSFLSQERCFVLPEEARLHVDKYALQFRLIQFVFFVHDRV